jgi:hypothetical protein
MLFLLITFIWLVTFISIFRKKFFKSSDWLLCLSKTIEESKL